MNQLYAEIKEKSDELKDMLGIKDICPLDICDGSGEVSDYEYDRDAHRYFVSGSKSCECRANTDEDE